MLAPTLGLKVTEEQALGIVGSVTLGGAVITTVLLLFTVPQAFVTARLTVYVPGFVKESTGFLDVSLVPLMK